VTGPGFLAESDAGIFWSDWEGRAALSEWQAG